MENLNAARMLDIWEQGLHQPWLQRSLILLAAACPEMETEDLLKLSIGQRDQRLLLLRERLFGSRLMNTAVCPECSERVEWENRIPDFSLPSTQSESVSDEFDVKIETYHFRLRLPNSLDLARVISCDDTKEAQKQLLKRCILKAECEDETCAIDQLPDHILQEIDHRLEILDPQAEIRIHLHCPECSHSWDVIFDITIFLWDELNNWAERTLLMIHRLAGSYGWTEKDILSLSPLRRQIYLGMLG